MHVMAPNQLLVELELTTRTIQATEALLTKWRDRQASITSVLDAITKPAVAPTKLMETRKGFFYRGEFTECHTSIGLYRQVMRFLWRDFPDRQEAMAVAMGGAGYNRRYISRDRNSLFEFKPRSWTVKFSEKLCEGWYIDTNVTPLRITRILPLAIRAAGLEWNTDIAINWD